MAEIRRMSLFPRNMDKVISGVKTVEIRVQYPNYKDIVEGSAH